MKAPSSCFCAGVNSSARAGAADVTAPARVAARPRAAISFMPNSKLRKRAGARHDIRLPALKGDDWHFFVSARRLLADFRERVFPSQRAEPGHLGVELQLDGSGRPVALLADDDFGAAVGAFHLRHPVDVLLGARPRLPVLEIVFLAI